MSIIEQTLDKLERSAQPEENQVKNNVYDFQIRQAKSTYTKSLRIFFLLFGILFSLSIFVIYQGGKLNTSPLDRLNTLQVATISTAPTQNSLPDISKEPIVQKKMLDKASAVETQQKVSIVPSTSKSTSANTSIAENCDDINNTNSANKNCDQKTKHKPIPVHTSDLPIRLIINDIIKQKKMAKSTELPIIDKKLTSPTDVLTDERHLPDLANLIPQQINIGNYQNAIDILQKYKVTLDSTWEYYYWKSQAFIGLGNLLEANHSLDIGLEKFANKGALWIQKGLVLQEQKNHLLAIDVFKKAEVLQYRPASLYLNMGYSAAVLNNIEFAKKSYNTFLTISNDDPNYDLSTRNQIIEYLKQLN